MDFELQYMKLDGYQPILDTVLVQEETLDSVVPDTCPDVSRIVCAQGNAYISSKTAGEGTVRVSGEVCANVLYEPENESVIKAVNTTIPFQCTVDRTLFNENSLLHAEVLAVCVEARLMNPRKLFIRTEVRIRLVVYNHITKDVVCDLASKSECSIQKRHKETGNHTICAVLEKPFAFSDSLHRSGSKPPVDELLCWTISPGTIEAKYIGKNLITKGELILSACYRAEDQVVSAQFELPFSQIMDVEGSFNDGDPGVLISLKNAACRLQNGELEVSVEAVLQAVLWLEQKLVLLNDIYSTDELLETDRATCTMCTSMENSVKRESYRKFSESLFSAKQVVSAWASLSPLTAQRGEQDVQYNGSAEISVLYYTEDTALSFEIYTVPVSCSFHASDHCEYTCCGKPRGEVVAVPVTGGFELRLEIEFSFHAVEFQPVLNVVSVRKSAVPKTKERKPSVILRMMGHGEDLWEVAKSCSSTIEDICAANQLSSDLPKAGSMLLIPVHR